MQKKARQSKQESVGKSSSSEQQTVLPLRSVGIDIGLKAMNETSNVIITGASLKEKIPSLPLAPVSSPFHDSDSILHGG